MSRLQALKRKQPESSSPSQSLTEHELTLYNVIKSKQDMGMWTKDMKWETKLADNVVKKSLKVLQAKNLIKEVVHFQNKGRKIYMATEFEPSKEITGGSWYVEGNLDTEFIKLLKEVCTRQIFKLKIATLEGLTDSIKRSGIFNTELSKQQIEEIVNALVFDNELIEVKSNGMGEFSSIPVGKVCYKCIGKGSAGGEPKIGALASIPCGVCPRIGQCTPNGIISPHTCVYYAKWLDF